MPIKYKYIVYKIINNKKMYFGIYRTTIDIGKAIGISYKSVMKLANKEYTVYQDEWIVDIM